MTRLRPDIARCQGGSLLVYGQVCPDRDRCALHLDTSAGMKLSFVSLRREPTMREPCEHFVEFTGPSA